MYFHVFRVKFLESIKLLAGRIKKGRRRKRTIQRRQTVVGMPKKKEFDRGVGVVRD